MLKVNIFLFFKLEYRSTLWRIPRRMQRYCRFSEELCRLTADSQNEKRQRCHGEGADIRRRGGDTFVPYALHSGVKQEGLIPVYVIAPYGLEVGRG